MKKNPNTIFLISIVLFIFLELFLTKNKQYQIGIVFYVIYLLVLFIIDKKYIIALFVFHLPLLPVISTEYKLFGLLGPHEIIYGTSLLVLFQFSQNPSIKLNSYQKLSINFLYLLFFISIFVISKDIISGLEPDKSKGNVYIFKNLFRSFLYYYSVILLVKVIYQKEIYNYVIMGIKFSLVTLVLSMVFTKTLVLLGAGIDFRTDSSILADKGTRFLGFYGAGGDENSAGVFLASIFAFLLALYEKTGNIKEYIIYFAFAVFGVLLTGSRTAFMALAFVILLFLITNKSNTSRLAILMACIAFYFMFYEQLNLVVQRFLDPSAVAAVDPNDTGRVGKWIRYIDWILNNPETLIYGNQTDIDYKRAPHNYLIYILYHTGIIPFLLFIGLFIKLLKKMKISLSRGTLKSAYYIIPFPLILMTVNSFGASIYLWLYLPMGAIFFISKDKTAKN